MFAHAKTDSDVSGICYLGDDFGLGKQIANAFNEDFSKILSNIDVDHLTRIMKEYVLNIEELEKRKQKSLIYSNDNFDWNKNSIALLSIIDQVKFQNKTKEIINNIEIYEKSRGIKFYFSNLVLVGKLKKRIKNIFLKDNPKDI